MTQKGANKLNINFLMSGQQFLVKSKDKDKDEIEPKILQNKNVKLDNFYNQMLNCHKKIN